MLYSRSLLVICFLFFFFKLFIYFTLQYCIGFAIHQHESATVYTCSQSWTLLLPPSLYYTSGSSQCSSPKLPVILHQTWTGDSFLIWYYTCFNAILPNHPPTPSPTESKRLFYTSVSLLLSPIQGYHYHLSKFHICALVYFIGVFLSGLLHSV